MLNEVEFVIMDLLLLLLNRNFFAYEKMDRFHFQYYLIKAALSEKKTPYKSKFLAITTKERES
jgi:hypothetical protein